MRNGKSKAYYIDVLFGLPEGMQAHSTITLQGGTIGCLQHAVLRKII